MLKMFKARLLLGAGTVLLSGLALGCKHDCCQTHGCSNCAPGAVTLIPAKPQMAMGNLPAPSPLPINTLPPVGHERYIVPEKPPQLVITEKPTIDESAIKPIEQPTISKIERRSFPDITARPEFSHAEDYRWLVGELHYSAQKDQWRLRYASIDEEDRYGGSVTLDGGQHQMKEMRNGMLVRVQGTLTDPDSRDVSPTYQVRGIDLVTK